MRNFIRNYFQKTKEEKRIKIITVVRLKYEKMRV